jgi:hypothetical protein
MENAHVDAVMILGQIFDDNHEYYDFGGQNVTKQYVPCIYLFNSIFNSCYLIIIEIKLLVLQNSNFGAYYNKSQTVSAT